MLLKYISGWFEYSLGGAEEKLERDLEVWHFWYFGNYAYYAYHAYDGYLFAYLLHVMHIYMHTSAAMEGMGWNSMHWHFWERWVQSLHQGNVRWTTICD